jgi:site-specific DNA-methyltransferase (adenine-specific)
MPNVELLHIDCIEYMKTLPDKAFDIAIVDPPYGVKQLSVNENRDPNSKFRRSMAKMVDSAKKWNSDVPDEKYFTELFRVSKEQIIWGANNFVLPPSEYFCIWDKKQTVDNFASAEYAWVSMNQWKKPAKVFTYQIHAANAADDKIHPTQKPVKLYKWLIQKYAQCGDNILDTHGGSRSLAIACHQMGFDHVSCEIDINYHSDSVKRYNNAIMQQSLFE